MPRLSEVVCRFAPVYLRRRGGRVPAHQRKALRAIEVCRTRVLGGTLRECTHCGHTHVRWHSCRNRHCPRCGTQKQHEWVAARLRELPPVPYVHLVFTVPDTLAEHCRSDPERLYRSLFEAASQSVLQLCASRYGCKPGLIAVLHTWGQNLHFHPHIHLIVTAGGLTPGGAWKPTPKRYFLPVRALSAIFRAKCFAALDRHGQNLPQTPLPKQWVVHARTAQDSPKSLLLYLARYLHRVAIDDQRILRIDHDTVTFRYKDYRDQGRSKPMTLAGEEFLRRFLQHVLPPGFVKIRHYGLFAHATKAASLARLREGLRQSATHLAQAFACILTLLRDFLPPEPIRCPRCRSTRLKTTELMPEPVVFQPP